jgi:rhamnose transport system permease protein
MRLKAGREGLAIGLLICVCVGVAMKEPRFLDPKSINSVLLWLPLLAVTAVGELLVIVMRGIDVSVGSIIGFSGIAVGTIYRSHPTLPVWAGLLAGLLVGLCLGAINGALITKGGLSPIVVTIATLTAFRGGAFLLSKGEEIDASMIPDSLTDLARKGPIVHGITFSDLLLLALFIAAFAAFALRYTQTGRNIFAFGSNPEGAKLRGVPVASTTFLAYAICGSLAGLTGVMYAARFGFVNPGNAGQNFELNVIAAVAIGGVRITGGSGSVFGALVGCLLLSCINVGLAVTGVAEDWQMLTYGIVILVALCTDAGIRSLGSRRSLANPGVAPA